MREVDVVACHGVEGQCGVGEEGRECPGEGVAFCQWRGREEGVGWGEFCGAGQSCEEGGGGGDKVLGFMSVFLRVCFEEKCGS